jgi:(R)-amidase
LTPPALRVALAQLQPLESVSENVELVVETVRAQPDSLVVFPELMLNGYDLRTVERHGLDARGPELAAVGEAARSAGSDVVVGLAESVADGVANTAAVVARNGETVALYRKTHLFGRERAVFVAGDELRPASVGDVTVGLMICFDMEFPETARALARRGARLLLTISANMEPFGDDHAVMVRARAVESRLPHVYVNRTGEQAGLRFVGESRAVDADGTVLAQLGGEPTVSALDVPLTTETDERVDYLAQLRPELYA